MDSFDIDLKKLAEKMELSVDVVARKVALEVYSGITEKTPVDTGRAKANWNLSVGRPNLSVNMTARTPKQGQLKKGEGLGNIWIANNLPYISALENGHSKQAAQGMVAITLAEVKGHYT